MRRIPDTLRAVVVTLSFVCIGWMGVVQSTTVVVVENPTSRTVHLDTSGPVWTDASGRLGTLYVDTPLGLCPCGQTCTPPRRPSQSIPAGGSRTYSVTGDAHRIVVGDDGQPCYRTEASYPRRMLIVPDARAEPVPVRVPGGTHTSRLLDRVPEVACGADTEAEQRAANVALRSVRDRIPGATGWANGCTVGACGVAASAGAGDCVVDMRPRSGAWRVHVHPAVRDGAPEHIEVIVGRHGVASSTPTPSRNRWGVSADGRFSVVGRVHRRRHTHGGAPAQIGRALFRVENPTGATVPITAASGVFIHNGRRRPLTNLSVDVHVISSPSADIEVYFAAHPAYQSWNDHFSAEVTFDVGGRRVTSEAAIHVWRVTPLRRP